MQPLDDEKLKQVLAEWKVPSAPASLEARLEAGKARPWWRQFLRSKIEVPVPVGALLVGLLVVLAVLAFGGPSATPAHEGSEASQFELVDDLNVQIIRSTYAND
jgi:hypothetical protein